MAGAREFDWDEANTSHIARHDVTPEEVEQVFANVPLCVLTRNDRGGEGPVLCAGSDGRRPGLQVVYTVRQGRIRIVTAHTAKRKVRDRL